LFALPGPRIRGLNPILCPSFTPTPKDLGYAFNKNLKSHPKTLQLGQQVKIKRDARKS